MICRPHKRPAELPITMDGKVATDTESPTFFISPSDSALQRQPSIDHTPSTSIVVEPSQTGSKPVNPVSTTKPSTVPTSRQRGIARSPHLASSPLSTITDPLTITQQVLGSIWLYYYT